MGGMTNDITEAATKGIWEILPCNSQVLAVHAALLHTGKVLFFSGSGNDPDKPAAHDFRSVVWDYENGTFHRPVTPIDFFCAGQSFLSDGRLLVAGGTKQYDPFQGLKDAYLFEPTTETWIRVQDMADGRWYPSLVTLGDGRILAVSGLREVGTSNRINEIYSNTIGWTPLPSSKFDWPLYPHLFLLRDGNIFYSGGNMGGRAGLNPLKLNLTTNTATTIGNLPDIDRRDQAASILLPPAQEQRFMIIGGGNPAIGSVAIVNLSQPNPSYAAAQALHHVRMHLNAVLLPDRTVLVSGGGMHTEMDPELRAEIYHSTSNTWTSAAKASVPRLYHSIALLLPDGRVITAGSNPHRKDDELRLELYHPPYLFKGPRPFIQNASQELGYGQTIEIGTPNSRDIKWVHLIRPMATTHSCDTEQRLVELKIENKSFCKLKAVVPQERNIAPPGWYMLFIANNRHVPSVAKWIHLT